MCDLETRRNFNSAFAFRAGYIYINGISCSRLKSRIYRTVYERDSNYRKKNYQFGSKRENTLINNRNDRYLFFF